MNTSYNRIKELADAKNISLAQVERDLDFSNGIISTWKNRSASADKILKVAKYFNVSTDYLLGDGQVGETSSKNEIKNPKVKLLARKMDKAGLDDSQLKILNGLIDNIFDKKFSEGSDPNK